MAFLNSLPFLPADSLFLCLYITHSSLLSSPQLILCFAFCNLQIYLQIQSKDMDLFLPLLALAVLCTFLYLISLFYKSKPDGQNIPPGNTGWPIIGETLEFASTGRMGTPEKFVNERMKKYSSEIFKTSLIGERMAVLCGAAGNKFLFSNENRHVVSWWPQTHEKIMLFKQASTIGESKKVRGYLPEFLRPDNLRKYVEVMDCMARQQIVTEWTPGREVKALPLARKHTFALACQLFMSIDDPEQVARLADSFARVSAGLLAVPIDFPGTIFNRAIKAANMIRYELLPIIKKRRDLMAENKEMETRDLLRHLILSTDQDGKFMTEMEIADKILHLLVASHDTTSTVITFAVFYLADHPHVYEEVLKEQMEILKSKGPEKLLTFEDIQKMRYSRNVVNEVLRLSPPAPGAFKHVISDFTYEGFTIPTGWKAHWSVFSTHQNPKYFPDPKKFDPARFEGSGPMPFSFVPFGGGPRMCPGAEFARLVILSFIHNLVTRFRWEKLVPDEKVKFDPSPVPVNGLPIRLVPHKC
ncbi:unnamed protein product [Ilex paraguariensis]|uniref:Cytochrome P450 n=1 Tax=Ilex paraguariensis TaxID=185542 RepID=A0ABC8SF41_9AQUA